MDLIKCSKCGKEFSNTSKFCPHCGCGSLQNTNTEEINVSVNDETGVCENVGIEEVTELKGNKKIAIIFLSVFLIVLIITISFILSDGSKIKGVSSNTYKKCTEIMNYLSDETSINEMSNRVERAVKGKYGNGYGSVKVSELYYYIAIDSGLFNELFNDIDNIPTETEEDETLKTYVEGQFLFYVEEVMHRSLGTTTFPITASMKLYQSGYSDYNYSFEELSDIYNTFIVKYDSVYNQARDIQDIEEQIPEIAFFGKLTATAQTVSN